MTTSTVTDDLDAALSVEYVTYRTSRDKISQLTLAKIVVDLAEEHPEARWLRCGASDQTSDLELCFECVLDGADAEVELEDEGDRYYGDVPLNNLGEDTRHVWEPFCKPDVPSPRHNPTYVLDLERIRAAHDDGTLLAPLETAG